MRALLSMLLLLLVVVVAGCWSKLWHDCATRIAAYAITQVTVAYSWLCRRWSQAYRSRLMNCWHHKVSRRRSGLLDFLLIVKLTDSRLHAVKRVVLLLRIVVRSVESGRVRNLPSILMSCGLRITVLLDLLRCL